MGVKKVALRDVAADNSAELDRKIVEEVRAFRAETGRTYMVLDVTEVDAMLRVIDSATTNH